MSMNVLSLFAGIGGLDLGLERAGMTVVGQVEIDPFCRQVLHTHWPEVPQHDDVRTCVDWWSAKTRPTVHVVAGGFPCQPFSAAGLRRGVTDERWGWPWMLDVVRAIRPRVVIVENTAALVRDSAAFGCVLGDLASLGFDAEWSVLSACAVGAPHTRERLFVVAHANRVRREGTGLVSAGERGAEPCRGSSSAGRGEHWLCEPVVDRVAHGVPRRVVLPAGRALGNAVVPQVAEYVGRRVPAVTA